MEITTIGLDLAKSIFQIHAMDAAGVPVENGAPVKPEPGQPAEYLGP